LDGDLALAASDFEALEKLRRRAFTEHVDAPDQLNLFKEEATV
jgi:putative DNA methylase